MKNLSKLIVAIGMAAASLSATAAESHIKLYTNVDTSLALLRSDGSALPDLIDLTHIPGQGLNTVTERVRIYTNDEDKDVEIRLLNIPSLVPKSGAGTPVPMKISLNKRELKVAGEAFLAKDLYDGALPGASVVMDLDIAQATRAPIKVAGEYEGIVSIVMTQKTTTL